MVWLRQFLHRLSDRFPFLKKLLNVGWKIVLTETLIEIPFLILESSLLMRLLFGFTLGLTFWQYVGVASGLYLLIEGGRWAFTRFIRRSNDYRFFKHEWELLQTVLIAAAQLRRKYRTKPLRQK